MNVVYNFLFVVYFYICLVVFLMGSLVCFDCDQYMWKSDSLQLLCGCGLCWVSNFFYVGILFFFVGYIVGLFMLYVVYEYFISLFSKQMLVVVVGGIVGMFCFIGLIMFIWCCMIDLCVCFISYCIDLVILWIFWLQFSLGFIILLFLLLYSDGLVMLVLLDWVQCIVIFNFDVVVLVLLVWFYKVYMVLGMMIFLFFFFSCFVYVWSGLVLVFYVLCFYQVVCLCCLNLFKRG